MRTAAAPERIRWAVDLLAVEPTDRLLEIGCGSGVAVSLICPRLSTGRITAIDRSAGMTTRARQRNAAHLDAGRAFIRTAEFSVAGLLRAGVAGAHFDKIFAVNVNLFWTNRAGYALALVAELLAPGGALYLCYEPPGQRLDDITDRVRGELTAAGFAARISRSRSVLGVVGSPAGH